MKLIYIITLSIVITSCQHKIVASKYTDPRGNENLLGKTDRKQLEQSPYGEWFNKNYAAYAVDTNTAEQLKPLLKDKQFTIFMGTWCGDSRREVPRICKILDYCGVKPSQVRIINVSNQDTVYKQSPQHEERGLYIHRVPDLLVYDRSQEKGRIVESPVMSLEKDLMAITTGSAYTPHYPAAAHLVTLFQKASPASVEASLDQTAVQVKPLVQRVGELNAFANVLMTAKDRDRALLVYRLNARLFPTDPDALNSLAGAYAKLGNIVAAKSCCQQVLQLQPGNQQATALLERLSNK